jgi:hypothetical protein
VRIKVRATRRDAMRCLFALPLSNDLRALAPLACPSVLQKLGEFGSALFRY